MTKKIKLITFDLDDTLWPIEPVMLSVQEAFDTWLPEQHPTVAAQHSPEAIKKLSLSAYYDHPELRHNLTALRKISLKNIFLASGYDTQAASDHAQEGYEVFHQWRNKIEFFPHALDTLDQLHTSYQLAALTNGNACLKTIGIDHLFSAHFSSENVGFAKPNPAMFEAALEHFNVHKHEVIHVGDNPEQDVLAAKALGIKAIWVNLLEKSWPKELSDKGDLELTCLSGLAKAINQLDIHE